MIEGHHVYVGVDKHGKIYGVFTKPEKLGEWLDTLMGNYRKQLSRGEETAEAPHFKDKSEVRCVECVIH